MRLIDADALIKRMPSVMDMQDVYLPIHLKELLIDDAPTVDAVPVRHGKWIKGSETKRIKENRYGVLFDAYYCSACESEAYWDSDYGQILFHYCPNCGARMVEDE